MHPSNAAIALLAATLAGCSVKGGTTATETGGSGETGDTADDINTPWVDGDMGECEGGTGMTSEFDGVETAVRAGNSGAAGPFDIEGEGRICGASCTHDYAWVHLKYFDSWAEVLVDLPADVSYSGTPDGAEWYLRPGTYPGPESDIGETITCQVNTSAGTWTATIEVREPE